MKDESHKHTHTRAIFPEEIKKRDSVHQHCFPVLLGDARATVAILRTTNQNKHQNGAETTGPNLKNNRAEKF